MENKYITKSKRLLSKERIDKLHSMLSSCNLCPRKCSVNRLNGEKGFCNCSNDIYVSSYNLHFGEEPPISGFNGSGTIFFTHCNLGCIFCQNYPISQLGNGNKVTNKELASIMLKLQKMGAHNINLVTPTHVVPYIADSLFLAYQEGLDIPLVFNSGGYESLEVIKLLEGIIDIYMPDSKYFSNEFGKKYSSAPDYSIININILKEMYRQVGDLILDEKGVAKKGLIIRHLVLPEGIEDSIMVLRAIANNLSKKVYLSIMSQYHPAYKSTKDPIISRRLKNAEYKQVLEEADRLGFVNGYRQE
ncbi:MAG: radical SAM protein [bacterium]